ncbi:MAG: histidinol dehydrogenase, partial [Treponema sp.]|nr:histidinol dehydrogenase [Treponema sp.]
MIKIQNVKDVEESFFAGRDFGDSIQKVRDILKDVQLRGDEALHECSRNFDISSPATLEIPFEELKAAAEKMEKEKPDLYKSICYSHDLALRFAKKQRESFDDFEIELEPGIFTGQKNIAVDRVGAYVPAGRFPLVSSVVMTITPAVAAGVKDIILCTPPRVHPDDAEKAQKSGTGVPGKPFEGGKPYADENIMAAAYICGATRVFAAGGSQAIAAMTFGTKSIPRADVIIGPGNKYVAEAKKLVYGNAGIDMIAGPSEVFVIADSSANPEWVAADLLA